MISQGIEDFLDYLRETEQLLRISQANEQEANDATQDILHKLELEEVDYHTSARLARKLKEQRQARRTAKDLVTQTEPIVGWMGNNTAMIKELERLLGTVRKLERQTKNRMYIPRTKITIDDNKTKA